MQIYTLNENYKIIKGYACSKDTTYHVVKNVPDDSPEEYKKPVLVFSVPNHFLLEQIREVGLKILKDKNLL